MFCVCLHRKDEREFVGTIYHKVSRRLETAVQMEWTAGSNDTKFAIAAKYCPDIDTTFRVLCCWIADCLLKFLHLVHNADTVAIIATIFVLRCAVVVNVI